MNKKITIGWTDAGNVHSGFIAYIMQILLHRHENVDDIIVSSGHYLSNNKNRIVQQFLNSESEWLLLLDSDLLLDLDNFDRLLASAEKDKYPIMSGMYFIPVQHDQKLVLAAMFHDEENTGIGKWVTDWNDGEILEGLSSVGGGFTLIHRRVYEAVQESNYNKMPQWYQDEYWEEPYNAWVSEDIYFFKKVNDLGFNICLNTSVQADHLKTFKLNKSNFLKTAYGIDDNHEHHHHGNSYGARKKLSWWTFGKPK